MQNFKSFNSNPKENFLFSPVEKIHATKAFLCLATSFQQGLKLKIVNCYPELLEKKVASITCCDGFLVPGGILVKEEVKETILYIKNARENVIPFFGE